MAAADKAFADHIKERDEGCRAAGTDTTGCNGYLQCAHLQSRRYKSIRWDDSNAVALCMAHHFFYTVRPLEWIDWVDRVQPSGLTWLELKYLAQNDPPERPKDALARLRGAA
jgi:hypothetical protein